MRPTNRLDLAWVTFTMRGKNRVSGPGFARIDAAPAGIGTKTAILALM
jgi:hypothetical protein